MAGLRTAIGQPSMDFLIGPDAVLNLDASRFQKTVQLWQIEEGKPLPSRMDLRACRGSEQTRTLLENASAIKVGDYTLALDSKNEGWLVGRLNSPKKPGNYFVVVNPDSTAAMPADLRLVSFNLEAAQESQLIRIVESSLQENLASALQSSLKLKSEESQKFVESRPWFDRSAAETAQQISAAHAGKTLSDYSWILLVFVVLLLIEQALAVRLSYHLKEGALPTRTVSSPPAA
jgi:hypothetical protein